ncbi:hypothetical protein VOLCADRAFT_96767 [Volvox carteri f. nagariensis]|uniref:Uncharacterized protein n=1 Tax=Volvox carteri f. nagariensis TaxID=3068 RepID=D8UB00_VOLCA|nr:uncharacterized protein VOLCADRAFT_96767 [Volvox carteri f. nagariensis]EFJ43082.1 hypothetical protein VOLCADRAFT_96767 [Volvox carteri f. nagariensis]|eukprot:XP_002955881.1 hypothetical protein VOLCADRAFT_96767 [Volvox carteri f. nagariensis]
MTPGPSMASNHDAFNVMAKYVLPRSADDIVKQQLPLATVLLVHLYGGGALLVPTAYHGLVDFEGLQTFVSHLSVAYNALLAKRSSSTSTGVGVGQVGGDSRDDGGFGSGYDKSGSSTNRNNGDNLSTSNNDKNRDGSSTSNNIRSTRNSSSIIRRGFFAPEAVERLCETNRLRPGSNPREAMAVLSKWSGPLALLRILYQLFVRGGGVEIRSYWIPPDRLADLKHAATQQLKKGMVEWVSTRDCLAARLMQPSMFMLVIANLRPRVRPPLPDSQLGNHIWGARVDCVRPSEMELGEVAARVRLALTRDLPAQYCEIVRQMKMLTAVHAARQLITELIITRDPYKCLVAPEGPIMVNEWRVQYDLWQFGPEPPFAFNPVIPPGLSPNLVCSYPAAPHGGGSGSSGGTGGLFLMVSLHRAVWRQLDAVTGGDLVGAL